MVRALMYWVIIEVSFILYDVKSLLLYSGNCSPSTLWVCWHWMLLCHS